MVTTPTLSCVCIKERKNTLREARNRCQIMILIFLLINVIWGDYVRSDQLAQVWGSDDKDKFPNRTNEVLQRNQEELEGSVYPKRYMDGMYGIGSQDWIVKDEILFLGLDIFLNDTDPKDALEWFNFDRREFLYFYWISNLTY